jgi:hypothetical protein
MENIPEACLQQGIFHSLFCEYWRKIEPGRVALNISRDTFELYSILESNSSR